MKNQRFTKNLLRGRVGEFIFENMLKEMDDFTIIPFGYEHVFPLLVQYKKQPEIDKTLNLIRHAPDFAVINHKENKVYLVEVKFRKHWRESEFLRMAEKIIKNWDLSYLFLATPGGFFFSSCQEIIEKKGNLEKLSEDWVPIEIQKEYLDLLNKYQVEE